MGARIVSEFTERFLMLPLTIWPLPASVGSDKVKELPFTAKALAPLAKVTLLNGVPAAKLFVVAVWVEPLKTSRSLVVGATPFQLPGLVQFPSGVAPPFHVRVPAKAGCRLKTQMSATMADRAAAIEDARGCFFIFEGLCDKRNISEIFNERWSKCLVATAGKFLRQSGRQNGRETDQCRAAHRRAQSREFRPRQNPHRRKQWWPNPLVPTFSDRCPQPILFRHTPALSVFGWPTRRRRPPARHETRPWLIGICWLCAHRQAPG